VFVILVNQPEVPLQQLIDKLAKNQVMVASLLA